MLFREYLMYSRLYGRMKRDLVDLSCYYRGRTTGKGIERKINDLKMIGENKVPENWFKKGFILDKREFYEFSKQFLYKKSFLMNFSKFQEKDTIINISKMFDPFGFFISLLWNYSIETKVIILILVDKNSIDTHQ